MGRRAGSRARLPRSARRGRARLPFTPCFSAPALLSRSRTLFGKGNLNVNLHFSTHQSNGVFMFLITALIVMLVKFCT